MSEDSGPAAKRRPTMIDVAREAGVSLKTVSRAVNGVSTLDPALAERVFAAVETLGFRRNSMAARLRSGSSTATIGLLIGDLSNSFYSTIASTIAREAWARRIHLITASSEEDPEREREIALDLCSRRIDGLIIVPTTGDQAFLRPELEMGTAMVFVDRPAGSVSADSILLDNRGGARFGAAQLLAEGHRRIGVLLDSLDIFTMSERLAGIREAFDEAGVAFDEDLLSTSAHGPGAASLAAGGMVDAPDPPTAFFAGNNRSTIGVVDMLWSRNLDARVVGIDDFELSEFLPRPVSLVSYDLAECGRLAAERLFARIAGDSGPSTTQLIPYELRERGQRR